MIAHSLLHNSTIEVKFPEDGDRPSPLPSPPVIHLNQLLDGDVLAYEVAVDYCKGVFAVGTIITTLSLDDWKFFHPEVYSIRVYKTRAALPGEKTDLL